MHEYSAHVTTTGKATGRYDVLFTTGGTTGETIDYRVSLDDGRTTGVVFNFGPGIVVDGDGLVVESTMSSADQRRYPGEGSRAERRKAAALRRRRA